MSGARNQTRSPAMVTLLPHARVLAWPGHQHAPSRERLQLSEVLRTKYETDAHIQAATVSRAFPRLDKAALDRSTTIEQLGGVVIGSLLFDVDAPDTKRREGRATDAWWRETTDRLAPLEQRCGSPFVYRTRGGLRVVYLLTPAITLRTRTEGEAWGARYVRGCCALFRLTGIVADIACRDWTRLFRVPHATRERGSRAEQLETLGDVEGIGAWSIEPSSSAEALAADATIAEQLGWTTVHRSLLAASESAVQQRQAQAPGTTSSAYVRAALRRATDGVRSAAQGSRNNVLNAEAYGIGGLVGAGLSEETARAELERAAVDAGLAEREARATTRSGLAAGMKRPRTEPTTRTAAPVSAKSAKPLIAATSDQPEGKKIAERGDSLATTHGLFYRKRSEAGPTWVQLTHFPAFIRSELIETDGVESRLLFEVEAQLPGRPAKRFTLTSNQFSMMAWPMEQLGSAGIVKAGSTAKDRAREVIQTLSMRDVKRREVFAHVGWTQRGDRWAYLHAQGAIAAEGCLTDVEVAPPAQLARFVLPQPPRGSQLVDAIRASLEMLELGPDHLTVPTYAAIFRSVLGPADFMVFLTGETGTFKSAFAALAQQHFGRDMDGRNLPGSWSSTGNALEGLAFAAKDALLVVDDFAANTSLDAQRLHRDADRLLRAVGNGAARQRMRADATLRPPKPPRALILGTGEDIPRGHSIRSRSLILDVGVNDINQRRLTLCQAQAGAGTYSAALAAFVQWEAKNHERRQGDLRNRVQQLREQALSGARGHRRTPEIVANLFAGFEAVATFAEERRALTSEEARRLRERAWAALGDAAEAQAKYQLEAEPALKFLRLLASAVSAGIAHVASTDGGPPEEASAWGWRAGFPQGDCVGWVAGDDLFLEFDVAHAVVMKLSRDTGEAPWQTAGVLKKRLRDRGHIVTCDEARETLNTRRSIAGQRRSVTHIKTSSLFPSRDPDQPDQFENDSSSGRVGGRPTSDNSSAGQLAPDRSQSGPALPGRVGRVDQGGEGRDETGAGAAWSGATTSAARSPTSNPTNGVDHHEEADAPAMRVAGAE